MLDDYSPRLPIRTIAWVSLGLVAVLFAAIASGAEELGQRIVEHGSAHGALPCVSCHGARLEEMPPSALPR
jgi:cytochrome c553